MPSTRSPKVRSLYSAKAFNTFRRRFSIRTPVCTRSTAKNCPLIGTNVPRYHHKWQFEYLRTSEVSCRYAPQMRTRIASWGQGNTARWMQMSLAILLGKLLAGRGCFNFCRARSTEREPVGSHAVPLLNHDSVRFEECANA